MAVRGLRGEDHRVSGAPEVSFRWVDSDEGLETVINSVVGCDRYAIDTEFHRERTYFPALALIQIGWKDSIALIDPTVVDISPLRRLFQSEVEAVFHAAQQDLDVLSHAVGEIPRRLFDTQIAGGFAELCNGLT